MKTFRFGSPPRLSLICHWVLVLVVQWVNRIEAFLWQRTERPFEGFSAPFPVANYSWAAENKPLGFSNFWQGAIHAKPTGRLEAWLLKAMFTKTHCSLITAWLKVWVSPDTRFSLGAWSTTQMEARDNTHVNGLATLYLMSLLSGSDREWVLEGLAAEAVLLNISFFMREQDDDTP